MSSERRRSDVLFVCTPDQMYLVLVCACVRGLAVSSARDGFCVRLLCTGHRLPAGLGGFCVYPRPCVSVSAVLLFEEGYDPCHLNFVVSFRWVLCDG